MWYIWIISSGIISIISVIILYILNKDINNNTDYRSTFLTIMLVSLFILSFSKMTKQEIVPDITNIPSININNKAPF